MAIGNRAVVDEDIAGLWNGKIDEESGFNWEEFANGKIGTQVLDFEAPVSDVAYVPVSNFLGIQGLVGYYGVGDGNWYYLDTSSGSQRYTQIPFEQASDGVYYLEAAPGSIRTRWKNPCF